MVAALHFTDVAGVIRERRRVLINAEAERALAAAENSALVAGAAIERSRSFYEALGVQGRLPAWRMLVETAVLRKTENLSLSYRMPVIENHGLRVVNERTYRSCPRHAGDAPVSLHDMTIETADGGADRDRTGIEPSPGSLDAA
jgi:hypothetical protein